MKNLKKNLPQMAVKPLYRFKKQNFIFSETSTLGDPTNNCGTVFTTTHILQK